MVLREEGMEIVCLHFGSTLPRCLEAAAKGKTTSTAQGKLSIYNMQTLHICDPGPQNQF